MPPAAAVTLAAVGHLAWLALVRWLRRHDLRRTFTRRYRPCRACQPRRAIRSAR